MERRQESARAGFRILLEAPTRPKNGVRVRLYLFDIVNAQEYHEGKIAEATSVGVRAIEDFKLEVRLRHPASYFLAITTFEVTFPQRQDIVEKFDVALDRAREYRHQRALSAVVVET